MPVRSVCRFPHATLTKVAEPVRKLDKTLDTLIQDLLDTMRSSPATVGLAAPQIGISKQVFVSDVSRKDPAATLQIFINPEIISWQGKRIGREGCLSLPDYTGNVARAELLTVRCLDLSGRIVERTSSGIEAICWQHEIDHLAGRLFIHRVTDLKTDVFRRKRYLT